MQELGKILEEMKESSITVATSKEHYIHPQDGRFVEEVVLLDDIEKIIHKHVNDGWIPVEEHPKKDYTAVFAVDKHDYYFVAVYDKEHGYRTNDVGADVDNIVAYCLFNPYRPERSEE